MKHDDNISYGNQFSKRTVIIVKEDQSQIIKQTPRWLIFVTCFCVFVGITLRFTNLEKKSFWWDEAGTLMFVTGHSLTELGSLYEKTNSVDAGTDLVPRLVETLG